MAEELQSLLAKINEEGVKKAEAEAARIIEAAKAEAQKIREQAKAEADASLKEAADQGAALETRAESAVRQAARDILLELQNELQNRVSRVISGAAEQALTPAFMTELIRGMAVKFSADPNAEVTVLAAAKDITAFDTALKGALAGSFGKQPKLFADSGIKGGMEVSFKDGQVYFDFTSDAVTELVGAYVGPRLAAMLESK